MTHLAGRYEKLGTETAFAVSAEASALAAAGHEIFPFHIGDLNFKTPENIVQAMVRAIQAGKTGYCPNQGIPELREALAATINDSRGVSYTAENVSIQPGGKPVINKFLLALMNPGDEVLYPNPGFPIYESLIRFYGGHAVPYGFREGESNFEIRVDEMADAMTPRTKLLILNDLHNPTGAEAGEQELLRIARLAEENNLYVLCDEAYFDLRYEGRSRSFAALPGMAERSVILYTFSKKYAMTGWRIGAAIGPKTIVDAITKFNVNDESCTNHFVQHAALEALTGPQEECARMLGVLRERRDRAVEILNGISGIRCYSPNATFYLYPNITEAAKMKNLENYEEFRRSVLEHTGVSFCTRRHFGSPPEGETERYVRLAYSGIDTDRIVEGLGRLKEFIEG